LHASQHGFQRAQSCTSQLLEFLKDITLSLDQELCVDVIYIDFSKAFDKVNHTLLLTKLKLRNIPEPLTVWIASFLSDRRQRVVLGKAYSEWLPVTSGVPQGSVLGPLLFNIYVDDIDAVLQSGVKVKKFADDTKIYVTYKPEFASQAATKLQESLNAVSSWCTKWLMELNVKKTTTMYFGKQNLHAEYTLNNQQLKQTTNTRDLGIIVSESGRVSEHCKSVSMRARRLTGVMLRTFQSRKQSVILPILKSIIRPVVEYASPVWCPGLQKDIKEIESVQRRVTKCIHGLKEQPYAERLQSLGLPSLQARRTYFDLLECYKITHGLVRSECKELLLFSENSTRGYHTMLHSATRPPKLNVRKHFFTERVLNLWNNLPREITQLSTYHQFKVALRIHLNV